MAIVQRRVARGIAAAATIIGLATTGLVAPASASAAPAAAAAPSYLALGDSVAFGYQPPQEVPPPNYMDPSSFTSYANDVAGALDLQLVNASCPGETTVSMLTVGGQSNGCENSVGSPLGYRSVYPLHVSYTGTQEAFATRYLRTHPDTKLVTIDIGANDAFVCQETTADHCTSAAELLGVLTQVHDNLSAILEGLRQEGGYRGTIVVLDYYSIDYASPLADAQSEALNHYINTAALRWGAVIGYGYGAFRRAAGPSGDPCTAGLLIPLPGGTCNVHPTAAGHLALASAILQALAADGYGG